MSANDSISRTALPIPDIQHHGSDHLRRQGSGHEVSADPGRAAAEGRAQRAGHPHRRRRLRRDQRLRRSVPDARTSRSSRRADCGTRASTRRRCARRRGRRCSPAATTTRSAWAASPKSRPRRPATGSVLPNTKAPLALTLKLNGYSTAQFGKCHEVPVWQTSPAGPFNAWPTGGGGFEYFYGFIGGENNQWDPGAVRGHDADRAAEDAGRGLSPHRRPDRQGHRLDAPAEGAAAGQAVLHLLRAGRHARAASRPEGVDRQVQGQVRARLGQAARDHLQRSRRSWA